MDFFIVSLIFVGPTILSKILGYIKINDDKYTFKTNKIQIIGRFNSKNRNNLELFFETIRFEEKKRVLKNVLEYKFDVLTNSQNKIIDEMDIYELNIVFNHIFMSYQLNDLIMLNFLDEEL